MVKVVHTRLVSVGILKLLILCKMLMQRAAFSAVAACLVKRLLPFLALGKGWHCYNPVCCSYFVMFEKRPTIIQSVVGLGALLLKLCLTFVSDTLQTKCQEEMW